jgi:predicted phosphodiesterase
MRYALLSDIHGNLPALEAVLADIGHRPGVNGVFHLGDLVGYAPWPNEVVATLRAAHVTGVAGNYDSTVATDYKHCGCRYEDPHQEALSHESYAWTRAQVSTETKRYLGALPFRIDLRPGGGHLPGATVALVHGTPSLNTVYWTADRPESFSLKMATLAGLKAGDTMAFGHTHIPWHREIDGLHFVNTGSVGRPKDGDWRAGYVLLDVSDAGVGVEMVRVAYDVARAADAILESTLPSEFAEQLRTGGRIVTQSSTGTPASSAHHG